MKRKIIYALGLYAVSFIAYTLIDQAIVPSGMKEVALVAVLGGLGFLIARSYFSQTPSDAKTGAQLAILWVIVGIALDWVLGGVAYVAGNAAPVDSLTALYSSTIFWITILVLWLAIIAAAVTTHGGALMKVPKK